MDIKQAAATLGVLTDDLRYYERIGLIPQVTRTRAGYRDYGTRDLNWIYLVKSLRQLGISDEILIDLATLSTLAEPHAMTAAQVELLADVSQALEQQITHLKDIQRLLTTPTVREQLQNNLDAPVKPIWK